MDEPMPVRLTCQYQGQDGSPLGPSSDASQVMTDRARNSEFYQYYKPFKVAVAGANKSRRPGVLLSSEDRALTAFAQLGALRLNTRRCAISFFDQQTQYILAEATRTLSLQTDEPHNPDDTLLWGVAEFPLKAGLCQYTLRLPLEFVQSDDGKMTEVAVNCIPDMSADSRTQDLPFVCGAPYTKFYAAVPIRSPTGLAIGSYCVMGDQPRAGLTYSEIAFLKDMATTVMVHMDMVRAREEMRRNALIIHGLGSFYEGKDSIWDEPRVANDTFEHGYTSPKWHDQQYDMQRPGLQLANQATEQVSFKDPYVKREPLAEHLEDATSRGPPAHSGAKQPISKTDSSIEPSQTANRHYQLQSLDIRHTFARAASIIRECTDMDGVVLYDASIGTFSGMVEGDSETDSTLSSDCESEAGEPCNADDKSDNDDESIPMRQSRKHENHSKRCGILGFATPSQSDLNTQEPPENLTKMTEKLLRKLLKRYPSGKAFDFDDIASPATDAQEDSAVYSTSSRSGREQQDQRLHRNDIQAIRAILPNIRSMVLVPFYDINRKRNYAGGLVWSNDTQRMFSQEQLLTYLAVLADSVMAEVARIEAKIAERTKSDFISSISHELRSPLHGILGGLECLHDTIDPIARAELLYTVETCSKTLLDTVDHLLEFTKVNNFSKASNGRHSSSIYEINKPDLYVNAGRADGEPRHSSSATTTNGFEADVNLATLTEEVIHTMRAGNAYVRLIRATEEAIEQRRQKAHEEGLTGFTAVGALPTSAMNTSAVDIIVEIDKPATASWLFRTRPGAWRRIVMNVFGNAMKYTAKGHVRVSLRTISTPANNLAEVVLTVSDTGRGISREFQKTKLFTPFAQEDYLAPGTGLGLSIIKQIITDMGGHIAVRSEQGRGTIVEVKMTMARASRSLCEQTATETMAGTPLAPSILPFLGSAYATEEAPNIAENSPARIPERKINDVDEQPPVTHEESQKLNPESKRVLIVDDNDINVRLLLTFMKRQGYHCRTASNGQEALDIFKEVTKSTPADSQHDSSMSMTVSAFDYILMDISMPVMDGLESTRRIRAHERQLVAERRVEGRLYKPTTVIALTGLASTETRDEAFSSGVNSYMPKPVKMAELKKVMAAVNNNTFDA